MLYIPHIIFLSIVFNYVHSLYFGKGVPAQLLGNAHLSAECNAYTINQKHKNKNGICLYVHITYSNVFHTGGNGLCFVVYVRVYVLHAIYVG